VLHVVWALPDLSSGTTEAFQLNDVSVQSLLTSIMTTCQHVTAEHVVRKLPYAGLQKTLREIAPCVIIAPKLHKDFTKFDAAKPQMQPRRLCST